jgi:GT2 family glycosyltransferase
MDQVLSIVCAYFPNNERLSSLVRSLLEAGDVIVVNNGGTIQLDVPAGPHHANVIDPGRNLGTLASYNLVIEQKQTYSHFWLWNQDSEISPGDVKAFVTKADQCFSSDPATVCVTVFDKKNFVAPLNRQLILAKESTSILSRERLQILLSEWFDEKLFMDYGDWDFSYRLYKAGGRINQIDGVYIGHQLGEPEKTVFGAMNRSSLMRLHMQGINTAYLIRKHGAFNFPAALLMARFFFLPFKNFLFKDSIKRTRQFLSGVLSGMKGGLSSTYATNLNRGMK